MERQLPISKSGNRTQPRSEGQSRLPESRAQSSMPAGAPWEGRGPEGRVGGLQAGPSRQGPPCLQACAPARRRRGTLTPEGPGTEGRRPQSQPSAWRPRRRRSLPSPRTKRSRAAEARPG